MSDRRGDPTLFGVSFSEGTGPTTPTTSTAASSGFAIVYTPPQSEDLHGGTAAPPQGALPRRASGGGGRSRRPQVRRTQQAPTDLHEIWEAQLTEVLSLRRDNLSDALATAVGVVVGLIPTCAESIIGYFSNPSVPLSHLHLGELIVFGVATGVAGTAWSISKMRKSRGEDLGATIRGQTIE